MNQRPHGPVQPRRRRRPKEADDPLGGLFDFSSWRKRLKPPRSKKLPKKKQDDELSALASALVDLVGECTVGDLFKAVTSNFSRFVLSWIIPSATSLAVFIIFLYPEISNNFVMRPITQIVHSGTIAAVTLIAFSIILLAMASALASRPLYRLLEGYTLPRKIYWLLLRRQVRQWKVLRRQLRRAEGHPKLRLQYSLIQEQLSDYPDDQNDLLPTRLGNAFKAMENYGYDRFGLDSQTLWYELHSVLPEHLRKDSEDARAGVDFFGGFLAHLVALAVAGVLIAIIKGSFPAVLVAVVSSALIHPTYSAAVKNMTDWRFSVQALVNVGRPNLAKALGYTLPSALDEEIDLWSAWGELVNYGDRDYLRRQDSLRVGYRGGRGRRRYQARTETRN